MSPPKLNFPDDHLDYDAGALRQALFDVYEALGYDTDGDRTPAGWKNLRKVVVNAAKEFRSDYEQALSEIPPVEPTLIEPIKSAVVDRHPYLSQRYGLLRSTLLNSYTPDEIRRMEGL